jgi:hypothetical protein
MEEEIKVNEYENFESLQTRMYIYMDIWVIFSCSKKEVEKSQ